MTWLLIILFLRDRSGSMATERFETEQQCRYARTQIEQVVKEEIWIGGVTIRCVQLPTAHEGKE